MAMIDLILLVILALWRQALLLVVMAVILGLLLQAKW